MVGFLIWLVLLACGLGCWWAVKRRQAVRAARGARLVREGPPPAPSSSVRLVTIRPPFDWWTDAPECGPLSEYSREAISA